MKFKSCFLTALAALTSIAAYAAEPLPLFNAMLFNGKENRFVLVATDGRSSSWLAIGDEFDGYTLKSYDPAEFTLQVAREGTAHQLPLATAKIKNAPAMTPATLADAEEVLRTMRFEEMMEKMMQQQKKSMAPMLEQAVQRSRIPEEHRERYLALQTKIFEETMSVFTSPEMRNQVAQIYSETFSKEELAALTAFHTTPAGQALIDKQPAIQQRMMEVMMPKMAQMGPRIQQLQRDFMAEVNAQKAAQAAPATPPAPAPAK